MDSNTLTICYATTPSYAKRYATAQVTPLRHPLYIRGGCVAYGVFERAIEGSGGSEVSETTKNIRTMLRQKHLRILFKPQTPLQGPLRGRPSSHEPLFVNHTRFNPPP